MSTLWIVFFIAGAFAPVDVGSMEAWCLSNYKAKFESKETYISAGAVASIPVIAMRCTIPEAKPQPTKEKA